LAQKLGIEADAEIRPGALAGSLLERGYHEIAHRSGKHRASNRDEPPVVDFGQRGADVAADALDEGKVQAAVAVARRPDADHRHVRAGDGFLRIHRRPQPALGGRAPEKPVEPLLDDGTRAVVDQRNLLGVGVDADYAVSVARETRSRDDAD